MITIAVLIATAAVLSPFLIHFLRKFYEEMK